MPDKLQKKNHMSKEKCLRVCDWRFIVYQKFFDDDISYELLLHFSPHFAFIDFSVFSILFIDFLVDYFECSFDNYFAIKMICF